MPSFRRAPFVYASLAVVLGLIVVLLLLSYKFHGNVTGFYRIGDRMQTSPLLDRSRAFIHNGKQGNDGQMFLTLAFDPLQRQPGTSAALDNPIYRGKRIFFPSLGWLAGLGQPALIPWALLLVNVISIGLAVFLLAQWFESQGQSPAWSLAFLAVPSVWIALSLSMAELVDTTLLIGAIFSYRMQRTRLTAALVTFAVLTRETSLLLWAGLIIAVVIDHRWKQLRWLLPAPLLFLGLMAYLKLAVPQVPGQLVAGFGPAFSWPLQGLLTKAGQLLVWPSSAEAIYDRGAFLLLLATVILDLLVILRRRELWPASVVLLCYLLPFLCVTARVYGRFPDYTRVMIYFYTLAVMALPWVAGRWRFAWLSVAGVASLGYVAGFLTEEVKSSPQPTVAAPNAVAGVRASRNQVAAQQTQVDALRRALRPAEMRYQSGGASSYLDLLDAQRSLFGAELSLARVQGQQATDAVILYKALGGGWPVAPDSESLTDGSLPNP